MISNSSVWTQWNVFFTSAVVLFVLFLVLFICYLISNKKPTRKGIGENLHVVDVGEESAKGSKSVDVNLSDPEDIDAEAPSNEESDNAVSPNSELSLDHKRTLLLARLASFVNGASFACHISLLPIQVTSLVDLDGEWIISLLLSKLSQSNPPLFLSTYIVYEYTTIVSSLGSISTVLLLLSFRSMARKSISSSMTIAYIGHMVGTAVLCIPQIYSLQLGVAVASIVTSYGAILLSFFAMNLSCEVSLGQLRKRVDEDAAAGLQMGIIKSTLSVGKVGGAAMVAFAFRIHPQLPLWILEGVLVVGAMLTVAYDYFIAEDGQDDMNVERERNGLFRRSVRFSLIESRHVKRYW